MFAERVLARRHQDQSILCKRKNLEFLGRIDCLRDNSDLGDTFGDRPDDFSAVALLEIDIDIGVCCKEEGQSGWEKLHGRDRIGENTDMASQPLSKVVEVPAHLLQVLHHDSSVALKR